MRVQRIPSLECFKPCKRCDREMSLIGIKMQSSENLIGIGIDGTSHTISIEILEGLGIISGITIDSSSNDQLEEIGMTGMLFQPPFDLSIIGNESAGLQITRGIINAVGIG